MKCLDALSMKVLCLCRTKGKGVSGAMYNKIHPSQGLSITDALVGELGPVFALEFFLNGADLS